jgi:hypothetical protein
MSHASRAAHLADLIDDRADLFLGPGRRSARLCPATEAGEGTLHLEHVLVSGRDGLYRQFEQAPSPAPYSNGRPKRVRSARGQLMRPSCPRASDNLYVPVEQTSLL